ncbi:MAG TPA: glycosyltransferase family 2 protein [Thermoanaerobaculia bacterium]|jgi:glycosyltransferase involved in cell wall biosynthesis
MPRVTVIMATYNYSNVLPYSIGSVLGQTFADFELLVIGDGCTDDSESVVRGIADPRVRWISDRGADLAHTILAVVMPDGATDLLFARPNGWMPPTSVMHRRAVTEQAGGWRDYRKLALPPEQELWLRIAAAGFRFAAVQRLTGLKFSASVRRSVYARAADSPAGRVARAHPLRTRSRGAYCCSP